MSAESLLSLPAVLPAVSGGATPAPASGGEDASAFEGMLANALGEDAAPAEDTPVEAAAPTVAFPVPMSLPLVPGVSDTPEIETGDAVDSDVTTTPPVQPPVLPGPGGEASGPGGPPVLPGPGAEAADPAAPDVLFGPGEEAPQPPVLPGPGSEAPVPAPPQVLLGPGAEAPVAPGPQILLGPDAEAPEPEEPTVLIGPDPESPDAVLPEILKGPGAEAPAPRPAADKSQAGAKGGEQPETLPGPSAESPRAAAAPSAASPDKAPASADAAPAPTAAPPPIDTPATAPVETAAAPLDDSAPAVARDASLSSLSRATIETTAQIAAQITRKLEGRSTRFEMALTPEGLGRVDVSLDIDADGQLAARLAFDNPLAALDMRGRVDELRRQLEDSGFKLADDAFQFTERDPQSRGDGFDGRRERAFARAGRLNADADLEISAPVAGRWMSLSLTPDRVDLKV